MLHPADTSPALKAHIKQSERLMRTAYFDPAGVPTIGWGHIKTVTAADVRAGKTITESEAQWLFEQDLDEAERAVRKYTKVRLNQNQFDALVDFVFNLGAGAFARSTLLKLLNKGDYDGAAGQFVRWNKAKDPKTGKLRPLRGLTIRREYEAALFRKPVGRVQPTADYTNEALPEATVIPAPTRQNTSLWTLIIDFILRLFGRLAHA
jgi:lysozyme